MTCVLLMSDNTAWEVPVLLHRLLKLNKLETIQETKTNKWKD